GGLCVEWDLTQPGKFTNHLIPPYPPPRSANFVAYSRDGERLAIGCGEGEDRSLAYLFHSVGLDTQAPPGDRAGAASQTSWGIPISTHNAAVNHAAFSPDGQNLVTSSQDGTARLWDIRADRPVRPRILRHSSAVFAAAFSPDGQYVVTASRDRRARIW